ncbi:30S ribosomal protein S6e [Candidatus Pacearchaeota archaeon]|nr:30S ribosomal protein S6e [Candidatus Pacearchaeota archaeon]
MAFKVNIAEKTGKTFHLEVENEEIVGKSISEKIDGKDISGDLSGYEFEVTGLSDKAGFPALKQVEGTSLKKVLLSYGVGMKKRSRKEGKKSRGNMKPKGLRLRKTVRGRFISPDIVQINLKVIKEGSKKLSGIFSEQNKPKEEAKTPENPASQ